MFIESHLPLSDFYLFKFQNCRKILKCSHWVKCWFTIGFPLLSLYDLTATFGPHCGLQYTLSIKSEFYWYLYFFEIHFIFLETYVTESAKKSVPTTVVQSLGYITFVWYLKAVKTEILYAIYTKICNVIMYNKW